ncbi:hypothetical protein Aconfl_10630 [Algoriphagus confluentis]|uniref:Uncharacterized protein n=1 Tax=Algoriphagus confluentis TaxID=1697556 RepID=A0ABQ6PME6_9BACT|nr:hypothetical protein Aconfl_10630 [Algoriphagus confluentis]
MKIQEGQIPQTMPFRARPNPLGYILQILENA